MTEVVNSRKRQCTLLLFVATSAEEMALKDAATARNLTFEKIKDPDLGEYHWMDAIGNEIVIAIRPTRVEGRVVMGELGRWGSASKGIRFSIATGAKGIVQLGMAFGVNPKPKSQQPGDVLVSESLIPYDNRIIKNSQDNISYVTDYTAAVPQPARPELIELFRREQGRNNLNFNVHFGTMLSGAARIHSRIFRDELVQSVPAGDVPIIGGDMEGVGLLAASLNADDPVWCIVKGISDFADENRDEVIDTNRPIACRHAAEFVLDALLNDARQ